MLQGRRGCNTIPCSPTAAELVASTSECAVRETPNSSSVFNSSGRCLWPYGESLPMQCLTPTSLPIHGFVIPVRFQALFMVASFKEGFPGIAQSVTFVHFLRSALLYYFFIKKAQKFDRGDEKMGTSREDNKEELSLPRLQLCWPSCFLR